MDNKIICLQETNVNSVAVLYEFICSNVILDVKNN